MVCYSERNAECAHCGHRYFSQHAGLGVCCHCRNAGRSMPETSLRTERSESLSSNDSEHPVTFAGTTVDAPGFTSEQFERAVVRAIIDELEVKPSQLPNRYIVGHPHSHACLTSRERCSCRAGTAGVPCKHRARLIVELDIREPAIEKQWAKLNADRPIRKAVA